MQSCRECHWGEQNAIFCGVIVTLGRSLDCRSHTRHRWGTTMSRLCKISMMMRSTESEHRNLRYKQPQRLCLQQTRCAAGCWDRAGTYADTSALRGDYCFEPHSTPRLEWVGQGQGLRLTEVITRNWLLGHCRFTEVLFCESAYRTLTKSVKFPVLVSLAVKHEY